MIILKLKRFLSQGWEDKDLNSNMIILKSTLPEPSSALGATFKFQYDNT